MLIIDDIKPCGCYTAEKKLFAAIVDKPIPEDCKACKTAYNQRLIDGAIIDAAIEDACPGDFSECVECYESGYAVCLCDWIDEFAIECDTWGWRWKPVLSEYLTI